MAGGKVDIAAPRGDSFPGYAEDTLSSLPKLKVTGGRKSLVSVASRYDHVYLPLHAEFSLCV